MRRCVFRYSANGCALFAEGLPSPQPSPIREREKGGSALACLAHWPEGDALHVITGLVPVIPIRMAPRFSDRDGRDKPGHDEVEPESVIPGPRSGARDP